jgi:hypothetical protein
VTLGISIKKKIKDFGYLLDLNNHDHGCFHLVYDGSCWSDNSAINDQYIGWFFDEGSSVTLTFSPKEKKLHFYMKGNKPENQSINVAFEPMIPFIFQ